MSTWYAEKNIERLLSAKYGSFLESPEEKAMRLAEMISKISKTDKKNEAFPVWMELMLCMDQNSDIFTYGDPLYENIRAKIKHLDENLKDAYKEFFDSKRIRLMNGGQKIKFAWDVRGIHLERNKESERNEVIKMINDEYVLADRIR